MYIHYFLLLSPGSEYPTGRLRSEHLALQKTLTNIVQISILIQIKKIIFKEKKMQK
jgi:hypothetical protein